MSLIQIQADWSSLVAVLSRIADALDRQWPSFPEIKHGKMITENDLHTITEDDLWREEIENQQEFGQERIAESD